METLVAVIISLFIILVFRVDRLNSQNYNRNYPYHSRQNGNSRFTPSQPQYEDHITSFNNTSSTFNPSDHDTAAAQDGQDVSHNSQDREDYSQSQYVPRPAPPAPTGNQPLTNSFYVPQNPQGIPGPNNNGNRYPGSYLSGVGVPGSGGKYFPSIPISLSKYVSGDYCWEPLVNCDTANTVLYCLKGRCACPTDWTLAPGNIPLNTVWHPSYKRCVSLIGSGCHTSPTTSPQGYVYCQPGVECVPHSTYPEVGVCGKASSVLISSYFLIFSCLMSTFTSIRQVEIF